MMMIKLGKIIGTALVIGVMFVTLPACQKQEGPAESAGKEVDKAADKVGQKVEKAGDKIQDVTRGEKK